MNTFKKWFAAVVEILKTVSYRDITESRGKTLGIRNIQPAMFDFSSVKKLQF